MMRYLFDTNHLTFFEKGHPPVVKRAAACAPGEIVTSAVNAFEALRGRVDFLKRATLKPTQRIIAFEHLLSTVVLLQQIPILPYDDKAENRYLGLAALRVRTGSQDLRIAAIALEHNLILVTQNIPDFRLIPGLVLED